MSVRVRFAPSPTGYLHIGGLRTALFNWLFARHHKGAFLLRIEDTDLERSKPEYTAAIIDALQWVGIDSDESIVIQTEQLPRHTQVLEQLLAQGKAYKCYCSVESVQELKEELLQQGKLIRYPGTCRTLQRPDDGTPYVIRFKIPYEQQVISFTDSVRGQLTFELEQFEDFVIARSDGMPMYNFVVVVDDVSMRITHVIRGEDHISNTPKQLLLYQACGFTPPQFAHIPLILGPSGNRLSKRDAAVSVLDYRAAGYLPEALCNYLVRLGWSHGDQEIFTRKELVDLFTLEDVGKKGAIFDTAKLGWVNATYMKQVDAAFLVSTIAQWINPVIQSTTWSDEQLYTAVNLYKQRVHTLKEVCDEVLALYTGPVAYEKQLFPNAGPLLETVILRLEQLNTLTTDSVSVMIKHAGVDLAVSIADIAKPVRYALTGKTASPGIYDLLVLLGKKESINRLRRLIS